jgi:hypothetical protein
MRDIWALGQWSCVREDQHLRLIFRNLGVAARIVHNRSEAKHIAAGWHRSIQALIERDTHTATAKQVTG